MGYIIMAWDLVYHFSPSFNSSKLDVKTVKLKKRVCSFTGMDWNGHNYRNGHHGMDLGALNVFYLHKMYFCSHMSSLHQIKFISV